MRRRLRGPLAAALLGGLAAACAGVGFEASDLPEQPLAIVHRNRQESERVADLLEQARSKQRRAQGTSESEDGGEHESIRIEELSGVLGLGPTVEERRADLEGRLALLDPRTGEVTRLDFATSGARPVDWSPDYERLLLMSSRSGRPQIYEYLFEQRELRPVTRGRAAHIGACYGPDGRLAFARAAMLEPGKSGVRIYVTGPDGSKPRPVTSGPRDTAPDWSAEAGVLVYQTRDDAGNDAIAAVPIEEGEAGEPRILAQGREPVVTPDGKWVVYSTKTRRGSRLWRMRPDGSARRAVAETGQEQRRPAVSPDGRFVAYTVPEEGEETRQPLWVRRLDGMGRPRPLLTDGDGLRPQW